MRPETLAIHAGHIDDYSRAVMSPIVLSTTFERGEDGLSFPSGYIYSRYDNPNRHALEEKLNLLEQGSECISFASGLTAAMAVFHSLGTGSHIILPDDIYFGVRSIAENVYKTWGLSFTAVDMSRLDHIAQAIRPQTKLIWTETPSNPQLKITDLAAVVDLAKSHKLLTACDNTWATPYFQQPLALGIDIVHHSTTKYLGGHSDILGGALVFKEKTELSELVRLYQKTGGAVPSPFDCWLLSRSLATFHARMPIHARNAMQLAEFLQSHPQIEQVLYPGLPQNPYHEVAKKQMLGGFGGMLSILVKGGQAEALKIATNLKIFKHATSLGGVESLIEHRKSIEGALSPSPENLLRVSVGIEHIDDLLEDFAQALA
ncbi:MAG: PLP-dependent aspartate aminotransferase family protein [Microscillaceae bacterium]|jgi:cystathionine gamma-synthase|nr:PLP-dependent aspartate aminotransferase family protein [Microscillaceae bacterium]